MWLKVNEGLAPQVLATRFPPDRACAILGSRFFRPQPFESLVLHVTHLVLPVPHRVWADMPESSQAKQPYTRLYSCKVVFLFNQFGMFKPIALFSTYFRTFFSDQVATCFAHRAEHIE